MIEEIAGRPEGTLEFRLTGKITGEDYDKVLTPAIERALEKSDRVRLLAQVGPGFEGYSLDAMWDDARLGLRHWFGFDRCAVVSDVDWVKTTVKALGFALPCPVKTFNLNELEDARRWLQESLGAIHVDEIGEGAEGAGHPVAIRLIGKIESSAYDMARGDLDAIITKHGRIRLLLDLREFDGWQGLGAIAHHLGFVRDHRHAPERVALVGNAAWMRVAERVASNFIDAETRFFEGKDYEAAEGWVMG